ncbi:glycosyl hydrolase family 28 protein [Candidatus Latescibacterota bacterium]
MINKIKFYCCLLSLIALVTCTFCSCSSSSVVPYPAPPGLTTSTDFTVQANGTDIWVERVGGAAMEQDDSYIYHGDLEDMNIAAFSCSGPVEIKITAPSNISKFIIKPQSRGIKAEVHGRTLSFKIPDPQKLYIEIDSLPHLAIFADPPEMNPPKQGDPGVVYFSPGRYDPDQIEIQSNQTIYIAPGAIVYANVRGSNLQNVKITGRGMLQGNVRISDTTNLTVDGIFIRNTQGWTNTLTNCRNSRYDNVKVFGYGSRWGLDGINPVSCRNFTIDNCFLRCRDDCVAIKSMNYALNVDSIFVSNNIMVGWAYSDGVTIGFELNGSPVQNIFVKNCDILYATGGGMTGGHSGFSIVCDGPAWVQNVRYEDIRIEDQVEFNNLELIVTPGKYYGDDSPGHIKGIYMKNISYENTEKPFIISGFSPKNRVEDITFDNCKVGGKILTGVNDANFQVNEFTEGIKFIY